MSRWLLSPACRNSGVRRLCLRHAKRNALDCQASERIQQETSVHAHAMTPITCRPHGERLAIFRHAMSRNDRISLFLNIIAQYALSNAPQTLIISFIRPSARRRSLALAGRAAEPMMFSDILQHPQSPGAAESASSASGSRPRRLGPSLPGKELDYEVRIFSVESRRSCTAGGGPYAWSSCRSAGRKQQH